MDLNHKAFFLPHLGLSFGCSGAKSRADCLAELTFVASSCQCPLHTGVFCRKLTQMGIIQFVILWTKPSLVGQAQSFINLNTSLSEL